MSQMISLCMIVKDEEQNLDQCLASIAAHVDEIIVVDTGSTDRTREVAVRHGASVHQFDHRNHPEAFFQDTEEECAKFGGPGHYSGEWALADFAAARNESFRHATKDFLIWVDADDVIEGAQHLRELVADMAANNRGFGFLAYNYATDHMGRVHYRQWRERVFRRGAARWHNPVHEVLMPLTPVGAPQQYNLPVYHHRRKADRKGIAHRNYKILLRQAWQLKTANPDAPLDPRILFYLGQEARFVDPPRAVGFYDEYLQHSGWPEERAAAHVAIGSLLEFGAIRPPGGEQQAYAKANLEYATASAEMPDNPDGLFGLARIAYLRGRHGDCVNYTERAFKIGNTESMLGANPMDRLYRPHIYYNHALSKIGRLEDAAKSCETGIAVCPDDPGVPGGAAGMLKFNLDIYRKEIERQKAERRRAEEAKVPTQPGQRPAILFDKNEDLDAPPAVGTPLDALVIWGLQLWKHNIAAGDGERARQILRGMPSTVTADPVIARMWESTEQRFGSQKISPSGFPLLGERLQGKIEVVPCASAGLDVVFWLGSGPEPWTPNTPNEKGLGGSETAAIEMARELGRLGHRCVVYAEAMGTFDGVEYRHHTTWRGGKCDVFVASRVPAVVDHAPIDARLKLLWVHDIFCGQPSPQMERWLMRFDRVLCLSSWHKQFFLSTYPSLHESQIVITRNGIDPARFLGLPLNNPLPGLATHATPTKTNSMVFSSSPNRGLQWLAPNFPHIRARVPDAELHVFYGFDTWETMAQRRGDRAELDAIEQFKALLPPLGQSRDGIYNHGKRPQSEVAWAYLRAKVWPYLTEFTETSCITAMEAMAAGCVPVCSALAALPETVRHGFLFKNEDPQTPQRWLDKVVELLQREDVRAPVARAAREYALSSLSWASLAAEWVAMFGKLIGEVEAAPIPMWRSA